MLFIGGQDISHLSHSKLAAWRSDTIGYIFQLYNLVSVLNAYENVEMPMLLRPMAGKHRHQHVATALDLAGIADRYDHYHWPTVRRAGAAGGCCPGHRD